MILSALGAGLVFGLVVAGGAVLVRRFGLVPINLTLLAGGAIAAAASYGVFWLFFFDPLLGKAGGLTLVGTAGWMTEVDPGVVEVQWRSSASFVP